MKRISEKILPILFTIAFAMLAVSCAVGKDEALGGACVGEDPSVTAERHSAFAATLSPVFSTRGCISCHDGVSGAGPGSFANSSPETAYGSARGYSNFDAVGASRFVTKIKENHQCGANCAATAASLETQIAAWASREAALPDYHCSSGGTATTTAALTINASDLSLTNTKLYRWDLSKANPPIAGAGFELKARLYYAPTSISNGSYILSDPKFAFTGGSNMRVSNITFVVDGTPSTTYMNFVPIDFVLAPGSFSMGLVTWNFPVLSSAMQVKAFEGMGTEALAISFDVEATADAIDSSSDRFVSCMNPTRFSSQVAPIFTNANRCATCHASAGSQANSAFSMSVGVDLCNESLLRSTLSDPRQSFLITHPLREDGGAHPSGTPTTLSAGQISTIVDWLTEEAQLNGL